MVQTSEPIDLNIVSQCDVIDCTYNEGQRCIAVEITVSFKDGVAQCATYTASSRATG